MGYLALILFALILCSVTYFFGRRDGKHQEQKRVLSITDDLYDAYELEEDGIEPEKPLPHLPTALIWFLEMRIRTIPPQG